MQKITREEVIQVLVEFAGIEGYKLPSSFYEGYSDEEIKEELDWIDYLLGRRIGMEIHELQAEVKELLQTKGFNVKPENFWEVISLIHTEVSEVADEVKKNGFTRPEAISEEVADIIIRTMNLAVMFNFDVGDAIRKKMNKNWKRPYKYGTFEGREQGD